MAGMNAAAGNAAISAGLGAATGGLSPLLIAALSSFAPGLISSLLGKKADPQQQLRKQIMQLIQAQPQLAAQLFQQNLGSAGFSQAQGQIAAGANQTANNLQSELGARGIGTSGTGAVLSSLTPSIVGHQQAQLRTAAQTDANQRAGAQTNQMIGALQGTSGPSQTRELFGAGLDAFGPMLQSFLKARYPHAFASQ